MAPIVLSILMISGIATLSAHMLPASSTDEATALCDESRHSSEASFVTIAIAAHFMTGAMNSSPELVMLFISSASSRRGAVKRLLVPPGALEQDIQHRDKDTHGCYLEDEVNVHSNPPCGFIAQKVLYKYYQNQNSRRCG